MGAAHDVSRSLTIRREILSTNDIIFYFFISVPATAGAA
jgi:hypothetical protein